MAGSKVYFMDFHLDAESNFLNRFEKFIRFAGIEKIDFEKKKVKAPKLGWISFHDDRVIDDIKIHSMTFSRTPSLKYYVSILYEDFNSNKEKVDLTRKDLKIKGLDMSLTNFFVDDEGNSPQYDRNYRKAEKKIAWLQ